MYANLGRPTPTSSVKLSDEEEEDHVAEEEEEEDDDDEEEEGLVRVRSRRIMHIVTMTVIIIIHLRGRKESWWWWLWELWFRFMFLGVRNFLAVVCWVSSCYVFCRLQRWLKLALKLGGVGWVQLWDFLSNCEGDPLSTGTVSALLFVLMSLPTQV